MVTSDAEILFLRTDGSLVHGEAIHVCLHQFTRHVVIVTIITDSATAHESILV